MVRNTDITEESIEKLELFVRLGGTLFVGGSAAGYSARQQKVSLYSHTCRLMPVGYSRIEIEWDSLRDVRVCVQ